jgi:cell division protein FtsZ
MESGLPERFREPTHFSASARVNDEGMRSVTEEVFPVEASVRVPFVGGTVAAVDHAEPDELDIPAFLRRGN